MSSEPLANSHELLRTQVFDRPGCIRVVDDEAPIAEIFALSVGKQRPEAQRDADVVGKLTATVETDNVAGRGDTDHQPCPLRALVPEEVNPEVRNAPGGEIERARESLGERVGAERDGLRVKGQERVHDLRGAGGDVGDARGLV